MKKGKDWLWWKEKRAEYLAMSNGEKIAHIKRVGPFKGDPRVLEVLTRAATAMVNEMGKVDWVQINEAITRAEAEAAEFMAMAETASLDEFREAR
jgi:hypothetical protein